ncbi:hypothetical protein SASPL_114339 [Salvia splendens]|uniref:Sieve element occlusion n=1 Tax=Salvia splendens TaxID=180675 RepID=A0A8X8Y692_SALSN|nr:hypothetical protein SASPL_114339 [Salvia splendens]
MEFASTKISAFSLDDTALRKKLLEHHKDGDSFFDNESLLNSVECIINHDSKDKVDLNCKCSEGDSYKTSLEILQLLANYTWEAKIVIILASFVVEYGHYCIFAKLDKSDQLTKLVALLKQIPDYSGDVFESRKSSFEAIMGVLRVSIKVTRLIAKFRSFKTKYMTNEAQVMIDAWNQIPIAVYWMTRVVVACASQYSVIVGKTTEIKSSYTETWSITKLEQQMNAIHTSFETQFDACNIHIEEKKRIRYVEKLKVMLRQNTTHMGNQSVLQTILKRSKDKESHLVLCGPDSEGGKKVEVEVLKGKTVLLLISDPRGRLVHKDAFSMMWTWGNAAYLFSETREQEQWKILKDWSLEFMVQQTTPQMSKWVEENKYICLFGGDDYDWIQSFVKEATTVASEAKIELHMVYIYKKNTREDHMTQITKTLSTTSVEIWEKSTSINFWKRIECLLYSKVHQGVKQSDRHPFLLEAMDMLALVCEVFWFLLSKVVVIKTGWLPLISLVYWCAIVIC